MSDRFWYTLDMKFIYIIILTFTTVIILWAIVGYIFIRKIETPKFNVLEIKESYEIRLYEPFIVAYTVVDGTYRDAIRKGFGNIADYIFGNNTTQKKIAMTSPVLEQEDGEGESIAMTSPVLEQEDGLGRRIVSFVMPSQYTLATLPTPNNVKVKLKQEPEKLQAVYKFSWWATNKRVAKKKQDLMNILTNESIEIIGEPKYAGYNPPLTIPFMQHHEILIEIK